MPWRQLTTRHRRRPLGSRPINEATAVRTQSQGPKPPGQLGTPTLAKPAPAHTFSTAAETARNLPRPASALGGGGTAPICMHAAAQARVTAHEAHNRPALGGASVGTDADPRTRCADVTASRAVQRDCTDGEYTRGASRSHEARHRPHIGTLNVAASANADLNQARSLQRGDAGPLAAVDELGELADSTLR